MSTKYRIRNRHTKNFVSKPTNSIKAHDYCKKLNAASSDPKLFEVVELKRVINKLPTETRPMTSNELYAIRKLKGINYATGCGHSGFANSLLIKVQNKDLTITDKQAAYLWWLVYHYRRQINDRGLIALAERNKIY